MKYVLNKKKFERLLLRNGYKSILDFSRASGIHRNTINNYLSGRSVFSSGFEEITKKLNVLPLKLVYAISDKESEKIDIDEIRPVIGKILEFDKNITITLLGSRAKGCGKKFSDWDIGILRISQPLSADEYLEIKRNVEELIEDLPREVDIVNLDGAPSWFIESIDYEPVFLDGNSDGFIFFKGVLNGIKKAS